MVVDSIMSGATHVMGFYTGHFDHVTEHTCALCEYPHGFVLSDDQLSIFHDRENISPHDFVYISSKHPGISLSANQISQSKYSTHGYQEGLLFFRRKSISQQKTSNRQHPSMVSTPIYVLLYSSML